MLEKLKIHRAQSTKIKVIIIGGKQHMYDDISVNEEEILIKQFDHFSHENEAISYFLK